MSSDHGKYCCFNCPEGDFTEKSLNDICPKCGKAYDFPLADVPSVIGKYSIRKPLGRGFYGATFVAEPAGHFSRRCHVLKVVPKAIYTFFKKDFTKECKAHAEAADGADFIVGIEDVFDAIITFGTTEIECHVAVLEFIDGHLLSAYLAGKEILNAATSAQIAADLFRIHDEFAR